VLDRLKGSAVEADFLAEEDANEFYDLCAQIFLEYDASGPSEEACAFDIAKITWRQLRPKPSEREDLPPAKLHPLFIAGMYWGTPYDWDKETLAAHVEKQKQEFFEDHIKQQEAWRSLKTDEPEFNLRALKASHKLATELDAQLSCALKRMEELKQMKR